MYAVLYLVQTPSLHGRKGPRHFSKAIMTRHAIPTAAFRVFTSSEVDETIDYVRTYGHKAVLKVSGLASGKGAHIPDDRRCHSRSEGDYHARLGPQVRRR